MLPTGPLKPEARLPDDKAAAWPQHSKGASRSSLWSAQAVPEPYSCFVQAEFENGSHAPDWSPESRKHGFRMTRLRRGRSTPKKPARLIHNRKHGFRMTRLRLGRSTQRTFLSRSKDRPGTLGIVPGTAAGSCTGRWF
jgi:hypothetical protein